MSDFGLVLKIKARDIPVYTMCMREPDNQYDAVHKDHIELIFDDQFY